MNDVFTQSVEGDDGVTHQPDNIEPRRPNRNGGFTLVEVLIIIAIIGLLAVIGIPQFIAYRSRSIDAQLKSDLRNAAVAVESYFTKKSVYPASIDEIQAFGFQTTGGVTMTFALVTPSSYTITAAKSGGTQPSFTFTSGSGSIN